MSLFDKYILLTGVAGYIGSHLAFTLLKSNYNVLVLDNFSNTNNNNISIIRKWLRQYKSENPHITCDFILCALDLQDVKRLELIFRMYSISHVFHLAGYKSVKQSQVNPLSYYDNNLSSTMIILQTMLKYNVQNIIFSSSATVYGVPQYLPMDEKHPTNPESVYGRTKYFIEEMLKDVAKANPNLNVIILRYFNPVCHSTFINIRETPKGTPENLFPYIENVLNGELPHLNVFGDDYDTPDGTCIRDYIHIEDLVEAHKVCLSKNEDNSGNIQIYNIGTGKGYSVLEIIQAVEKVKNISFPYVISERRDGDVPSYYADASKIRKELSWNPKHDINDIVSQFLS
jgi:UDP-glucose 4-epimerase